MSACCVVVVSSRPESTRSVALLGRTVPLLGLINAARLFPQGPSRELPRHHSSAGVTELQFMDSLMVWGSPTNDCWRQKTRVHGLSRRDVVCVILRLAVLTLYPRRVTDRHTTNRHDDGFPASHLRTAPA